MIQLSLLDYIEEIETPVPASDNEPLPVLTPHHEKGEIHSLVPPSETICFPCKYCDGTLTPEFAGWTCSLNKTHRAWWHSATNGVNDTWMICVCNGIDSASYGPTPKGVTDPAVLIGPKSCKYCGGDMAGLNDRSWQCQDNPSHYFWYQTRMPFWRDI